jgi:predicted transcriptional regulator
MKPSVITKLRDFIPITALTREKALRLAEMQATRFRVLTDNRQPLLPTDAIAELPRIQVERMSPLPVSGATAWSNGRWVVLLRGSEPTARQRFSLAHEFKHILDHRFIDVLYERIPEDQRHAFVEQVCDYFAGCLLMPRPLLRKLWKSGVHDVGQLAAEFGVSQPAIQTRLAQIGLTTPQTRCGVDNADWALPLIRSAGSSSASYNRSAHPLWVDALAEGVPA